MFLVLTHVELVLILRSTAAILEMPQYVAYQINVVYAFIKLSSNIHSFNILCTMVGLAALLKQSRALTLSKLCEICSKIIFYRVSKNDLYRVWEKYWKYKINTVCSDDTYTGSVQIYSKRLVFVQQSKISHLSFCNPTTSVLVIFCKSVSLIQKPYKKSITCDQKAWVGRRYNGIFSRSEWCWYIINLTVNKVWLAPSSRSLWVIPTWK